MSRIDEIRERLKESTYTTNRNKNLLFWDIWDEMELEPEDVEYLLDRCSKLEEQLTKAWYLIDHKNHTEYDEMVDGWRKEKEALKEE